METKPSIQDILQVIYRFYETWAGRFQLACGPGCAACCTRNVMVIRAEGEHLLDVLREHDLMDRVIQKDRKNREIGYQQMTANQWAACCLGGENPPEGESTRGNTPCPMLNDRQECTVYASRPFSCRCFGSTVTCGDSGAAEQPELLMEVNTVTMQLIEHLGQGRWWGNMLDMLEALILLPDAGNEESRLLLRELIGRLHTARPLPGFLVMPEQQAGVQEYLDELCLQTVGGTPLGEILRITQS